MSPSFYREIVAERAELQGAKGASNIHVSFGIPTGSADGADIPSEIQHAFQGVQRGGLRELCLAGDVPVLVVPEAVLRSLEDHLMQHSSPAITL